MRKYGAIILLIFLLIFSKSVLAGQVFKIPEVVHKYYKNPVLMGQSSLYYWGFHIYDVKMIVASSDLGSTSLLKSGGNSSLHVKYFRDIARQELIDSSIEEMQRVKRGGFTIPEGRYISYLESIYGDVKDGDIKIAVKTQKGLDLYHNDRFMGSVDDIVFANLFFDMWLGTKAKHQNIRKELLNID